MEAAEPPSDGLAMFRTRAGSALLMSDYYRTTGEDDLPLFPSRAPKEDRKRLTGQCKRIVDMLREGPKTNDELSRVSRKYTSRISDIRKAGYTIPKPVDLGGGVALYKLTKEPW